MARILKLRYMGIPINIYITPIKNYSSWEDYETAEGAWNDAYYGVSTSNITPVVGYAQSNSELNYRDYYNFVGAFCGTSSHNCNNVYAEKPAANTWDEQWPTPCGSNKILIPPAVSGQNWVCPKNGRYVVFEGSAASGTLKARVYTENGGLITPTSGTYTDGFSITPGQVFIWGVSNYESFRNASSFADALNYSNGVMARNRYDGKIRLSNAVSTQLNSILRVVWELVKKIGDEDDPTDDPSDDPYSGDDSPYDPPGPGGDDGDDEDPYDDGDDIPYPDDPVVSVGDSGLLEIYTPSTTQLNLLAGYLWSSNFVDSLVKELYADPMDVIISIGILPFAIPSAGSKEIKVGDRGSGVNSNYPSSGYYNFDCGTVDLKTVIGSYLDYAPYTKGQIFLPYIGYVPLDVDTYMGKTINIKYKVDISNGSAICYIMANSKVMQSFSCNLMLPIPLSAANYSAMWGSILAATATLAGAGIAAEAAIGGAATAAASEGGAVIESGGALANSGAVPSASSIINSMATKPAIQKSNNIGVSTGMLSVQYPYIVLERPNICVPGDQNEIMGYPSYISSKLSDLSGYTRISQINLSVPSATAQELAAIETNLKSGVIISSGTTPAGSGITLYKNNSPKNTIGKTLTNVANLTGVFRDNVDINNPIFTIEKENPADFNYVYIADFGRCYYVNSVNVIRKNLLEVHCTCDPLNSFASEIKANKGIIDKQQTKYNLYLNDDSLKVYQNPLISTWKFPNRFGAQYTYVLLVAGD